MFKLSPIRLFVILAAVFSIQMGCQNDKKSDVQPKSDSTVAGAPKASRIKTTYKLPSPFELYQLLRDGGAKYNKDFPNPVDNLSKYNVTRTKAINFGIYASDLAYSTVFAKPQQTFFYFKVAKTLANDLGLTQGFNESIAKRIENNLNNSDSLYQITSDSYSEACNFLEEQGKADVLGYILVGGWIESVYIAVNSVDKFSPENETVMRVTEQQFLLENLLQNLNEVQKNPQIDEIINKMSSIKAAFDKLYENTGEVIITKQQFNEISSKIKELRSEFIK